MSTEMTKTTKFGFTLHVAPVRIKEPEKISKQIIGMWKKGGELHEESQKINRALSGLCGEIFRRFTANPKYSEDYGKTEDEMREDFCRGLEHCGTVINKIYPFTFKMAAFCFRNKRRPDFGESGHCLRSCDDCHRSDIPGRDVWTE